MRNAQAPPTIFFFLIPLLAVGLLFFAIAGLVSLWAWARRRRLAAFAAAEGVRFEAKVAPIALPQGSDSPPIRIHRPENFIYGNRNGVEVFACDFQIGHGRGAVTISMVGVRSELPVLSELDQRRWRTLPLNGWTFLIPRNSATAFSGRQIRAAWDLLTPVPQVRRQT